jgi:DNA-binding CsgD family transcriptional regulator
MFMGALAPVPRLCGRAAEFAVLGEVLDRVASGQPAVVLVEGEAGIGKTRLADEALADARGRGMQVMSGRAEEMERTRPFGLVADVFGCARSARDPRRAAIAAMLSGGGGDRGPITVTSDPGLQFRVVDAFVDLVEEFTLSGPLVIGVDDLQWADPSSLLTLAALGRRLGYLPIALIGCFRLLPRPEDLERLCRSLEAAGGRRLTLRPLADDAVADLVAETVAADPGPVLLAEIAGAGGNPLFVIELVGALAQEEAIKTTGGRAEVEEAMLPPTLRLTILRRLSFLHEDTLRALRAASILGSGFSLTDLAAVTGWLAVDLSAVLAEAITARVLADDGAVLRFRHDLIRESIYADLPVSVRRGLHREAGQRLAQSGAPSLQVAEHLARGAAHGDAEAIGWLTRAARDEVARSPDVAADLLNRAAGLTDPSDPGRDRLLAERASSLMLAGRIADAEAACLALLDRGDDPLVEGPVRICLGHALLAHGQGRDALRELDRAVKSPSLTGAERAYGLGWASFARLWLGDLDSAAVSAEQARSAAAAAGDQLSTSIAVASLALVSEFRGDLRVALQIIDDAALADHSAGSHEHRYPVCLARGHILMEMDRPAEARAALETARRISEESGVRWFLPSYQAARAMEHFIAGEWDDAIAELEASVGQAEETGRKYGLVYALGVLSLINFHRGDLRGAREAAAAAAGELSATDLRFHAQWATWAQALLLEADGQISDAFAILTGCWDQGESQRGLMLEYPVLGADLVRLALACGERRRAQEVAAAVAQVAEQNEVPSLAGAALRCRGLAEDDSGVLLAAARAYAGLQRPLELALASEDAGTAFTRRGHADHARPLLEQAVEIYERLDAARDLARAEAALRATGIVPSRGRTRSRPQFGWPSLTPAEHAVAALVAEGLSNPQIGERLFVSRRTVQTHLAHVFAKLDLNSRAQLAAEVTRQRGKQPIAGGESG